MIRSGHSMQGVVALQFHCKYSTSTFRISVHMQRSYYNHNALKAALLIARLVLEYRSRFSSGSSGSGTSCALTLLPDFVSDSSSSRPSFQLWTVHVPSDVPHPFQDVATKWSTLKLIVRRGSTYQQSLAHRDANSHL